MKLYLFINNNLFDLAYQKENVTATCYHLQKRQHETIEIESSYITGPRTRDYFYSLLWEPKKCPSTTAFSCMWHLTVHVAYMVNNFITTKFIIIISWTGSTSSLQPSLPIITDQNSYSLQLLLPNACVCLHKFYISWEHMTRCSYRISKLKWF